MKLPELDRLRGPLLAVLLAVSAVASYQALRTYCFEDAYITYRYAANLAAGDGFVFQPGERVLGTSTPLYTLLLALLAVLGLDVPTAGGWVYSLSLAAAGGLGAWLLARRGRADAGALFAVAAAWGFGGVLRFFGMETTLYLALVLLAVVLATADRPWATGLVLGLVCTTRYDGVVAAGAVLACRWLATRRLPWREAVVSGTLLGGWLVFAWAYFGSPLPNTLGAKSADTPFPAYLAGSIERQFAFLFDPLRRFSIGLPEAARVAVALALVAPLAWGLPTAVRWLARRLRPSAESRPVPASAPLALTALGLWLGYAVIGPPVVHDWYLVPAVYGLLLLSLAGWGRLLGRRLPQRARKLGTGVVLAIVVVSLVAVPVSARREARLLTELPGYQQRIPVYDQFARWIERHGFTGATLFTREPGYLTFRTRQPVIDGAGLVTRDVFFHGPEDRRTDVVELFDERRPELLILTSRTGRQPWGVGRSYLPVVHGQPMRALWLRREVFAERFDDLYASWLGGSYYTGAAPATGHPLDLDFGTTPTPGWRTHGPFVGPPPDGLRFAGRPVEEALLVTPGDGETSVWSPPFRLDFDQLDLRFASTHPGVTAMQLFADGLEVFALGGVGLEAGELIRVEVPVHAWRGRVGELRFVDADPNGGQVLADHLRSRRHARSEVFDDFESGTWSERWDQTFGDAPASNVPLARRHGLHLAQGRFFASSLGRPGPQVMVSRPFVVEHDRLAFTVYDFGDHRTRVELRVAGHRKHLFAGGTSRDARLVIWDLSRLRGREAVIVARDEAEEPHVGLGIDSFLLYDPSRE